MAFPRGGRGKRGLREQLLHHRTDDASIFEAFLKQICGLDPDAADRNLFLQAMHGEGEES